MTNGSLGRELDLLANYPKTKRDVSARGDEKTEEDRAIARQFGKAFFDGERRHGYGGFHYHPRFWEPVVPTFQSAMASMRTRQCLISAVPRGLCCMTFSD